MQTKYTPECQNSHVIFLFVVISHTHAPLTKLKMAYTDNFEDLQLKGVTEFNHDELGHGAYGVVYAVKYCQTICAAK